MKQIEFEEKVRELKTAKNAEVNMLERAREGAKMEVVRLRNVVDGLMQQRHAAELQMHSFSLRRMEVEKRFAEKEKKLREEFGDTLTRNLEDVSEWALINELHARGYRGSLVHENKDVEFMQNLNSKLNGRQVCKEESGL